MSTVIEKYIAFREKDLEGDVWCEKVFLFKTQDGIRQFFNKMNKTFVELFTDEDNTDINDLEINSNNPAGKITSIHFNTEYSGGVHIYEMSGGYVVE